MPDEKIEGIWKVEVTDARGRELGSAIGQWENGSILGQASGDYSVDGEIVRGTVRFIDSRYEEFQFEGRRWEDVLKGVKEIVVDVIKATGKVSSDIASTLSKRMLLRRRRVTLKFWKLPVPKPLNWEPYPFTEEIRNSPVILRFSREHPGYGWGKDNIFEDTKFHQIIQAEFQESIYINQSARMRDFGPADVIIWSISSMIVAFGGPATLLAFLKCYFNKIAEWENISSENKVEVKIGDDITIQIKGPDPNEVIRRVEDLIEFKLGYNSASSAANSHTITREAPTEKAKSHPETGERNTTTKVKSDRAVGDRIKTDQENRAGEVIDRQG